MTERSGHKLQTVEGMRPFGVTARYISGTMNMPSLVDWLSWRVERPVVDQTGLSGTYDIQLAWTPDPESRVARTDATTATTTSVSIGRAASSAASHAAASRSEWAVNL